MSRASKLSAVILACALTRAAAVELEGPAGTPAPTPVPLAPAGLAPIVVPAIDPLQTPVGLDAALSGNVIPEAAEDGALPRAAATAASASAKTATASVEAQARSARAKTTASVTRISDHVAKAAEAAGKADATGEDRAGATRSIERELTGERETPSDDYASVYLRGVADGSIPTGPRLERAAKPGEYRARTGYNVLYGTREELVNPGHVYA